MRHAVSFVALAGLLPACGGSADSGGSMEVVRDTVGDTIVVRTVSGSVWDTPKRMTPEVSIGMLEGDPEYLFGRITSIGVGSDGTIYVLDRQVPDLRAFDAEGSYLMTMGGQGEGPGELSSPGALTVLSDGRILVRDPGNARIQVFDADGTPGGTWPVVRGGFSTSRPLWSDADDNVYVQVLLDPEADIGDWAMGLARIGPDGAPLDTLAIPDTGYEAPFLEARVTSESGTSVSRNNVPFSPTEQWTLHPDGYFVHGLSTDYRFTLYKPSGPLRVERVYEPAPVRAAEASQRREQITRNMRRMKPDWRWNGPDIPDHKPPFTGVHVGRDGRIWVRLHQPGIEEDDPDYDPREEGSMPTRWTEPIVYDVFSNDGAYLGRVEAPDGFSPFPAPVFASDYVWAVTRDDLDVQRVVRYRLEPIAG